MRKRRTSLIIRQEPNRDVYHVGYWDYPTPTQHRQPVFRSLGMRADESAARELARYKVKHSHQYSLGF